MSAGVFEGAAGQQPVPAAGRQAPVRTGIRAQSYSRRPCAPAPADSRCQARAGSAAISASARCEPSGW